MCTLLFALPLVFPPRLLISLLKNRITTPFQKPAAISFKGDSSSSRGRHYSYADRSGISNWMHVWRRGPAGFQVRAPEAWPNTGPPPSAAAVGLHRSPTFPAANQKPRVRAWSFQHIISSPSDTVTYLSWLHRNSWKGREMVHNLLYSDLSDWTRRSVVEFIFTSSHKLPKNISKADSLQTHTHNSFLIALHKDLIIILEG